MSTKAEITKGEQIALFASNAGVALTTLIGVAYFARWIPINTEQVWTISVVLLVLYFVSVSITAITLRRLRKRQHPSNFNAFSAAVGMGLWVPVFIVWLAIVAEIYRSTITELMPVALSLLPATAIAMALFCYIIDEVFIPGPKAN